MLKRILFAALWLPLIAFGQSFTYPSVTFQNLTVLGTFSGGPFNLGSQAANTVVANATASSAAPTAFAMPSCSASSNALQWTSGAGFTCTSILPAVVAQVNATAQTASISGTTLYSVPANGAGFYLVIVDLICTTAGTAGTVSANAGWNNGSASVNAATSSVALNGLGNETAQTFTVYSAASQNISYSTTVNGASGSPQYAIRIRLVYLG